MSSINSFSFNDFSSKKELLKKAKMTEEFQNLLEEMPFIEQAALITHYLQLDRKGVVLPYRDKAQDILS